MARKSGQANQCSGEMTEYVCGFAFTDDMNDVVLIRKNRPEWQAGLLNGVGGHIEPGEGPAEAMTREVAEETGVETKVEDWTQFAVLDGDLFRVYFFMARTDDAYEVQTMTDEKVQLIATEFLGQFQT